MTTDGGINKMYAFENVAFEYRISPKSARTTGINSPNYNKTYI